MNKTENSLHNLYQTIIELSKYLKTPCQKQTTKRELKTAKSPINLNVNIENYLLKKPREGRAFIPKGTSNTPPLNDLSFIPIEKMIVEEEKSFTQDDDLIELPTSDLFSVDTKALKIEDIDKYTEDKTKSVRKPPRYFGLKIKKMKSNSNRKGQEKGNSK